jgi:fibronectin type 3 domain-containing protein
MLVTLLLCAACEQGESVRVRAEEQQQTFRPQPELTAAEAAKIPPFPPTNVSVKSDPTAATVTWEPSPLENVITYRVYRKVSDSKLVKIGETSSSKYVDVSPKRGAEYSVTAVNVYGAESPFATTAAKKNVK